MIKKDKEYTYDELKEIIDKAIIVASARMDEKMNEINKDINQETNSMQDLLFKMHNMVAMVELENTLFDEKEN